MSFDLTTFTFELINFVVLLLVLQRILYRPLRRGIEARRAALAARESEAQRLAESARAQMVEQEDREHELHGLRDHIMQEATEEASAERARILAQAREDAAAERVRVDRLLEAEREASLAWVQATAIEQSTALTGQLLMRLAPQAVHTALGEHLREALQAHASTLQELGRKHRDGVDVEVLAATMPTAEELDGLRETLEGLLEHKVRFAVREDDRLRAGFVVRVGDRVFDGSVRGQLDAFRALARTLLEPEVSHG